MQMNHMVPNQSVHCPSQKEKGGGKKHLFYHCVQCAAPGLRSQSIAHGGHATNLCQIIELVNN